MEESTMRTLWSALLLGLLGSIAACNGGGGGATIDDQSVTAATFVGGTITQAEVEAFLASIPERQRTRFKTPDGREDMIERIALNKALTADAQTTGLGTSLRDQLAMRQAADTYLINRFVQDLRAEAKTEQAARAYYDENIEEYKKEQVQARHILLKDEAAARDARLRLDDGTDFETLAKELSEDRASKVKGGDLGWFGRGRMAPEFEEAAFGAEAGSVVGPIKTRFGYHIIRVEGSRDEIPFEEVLPRIERRLEREAVTNYMDAKKETLEVVVDEAIVSAIDPDVL